MPSDVPEDTSPEDTSSTLPEDTSSTESAMLEPDSPKIAGGEKPDKKEGALVIPANATVGENPIIDIRASIQRRGALNRPKGGKYRAPPGTAKRRMAEPDEKPKKTQKSSDNPEDHLQLKNPPECEILVPVKPGINPSVVIPPSTETKHKITEPPLLPQHN